MPRILPVRRPDGIQKFQCLEIEPLIAHMGADFLTAEALGEGWFQISETGLSNYLTDSGSFFPSVTDPIFPMPLENP